MKSAIIFLVITIILSIYVYTQKINTMFDIDNKQYYSKYYYYKYIFYKISMFQNYFIKDDCINIYNNYIFQYVKYI